ncbi:MAG TPA: GntR family transcriptional regulator [Bradyrhizobium sp.]|nr:GntR family transcriptional regulator [Bradyrhizobium sp.]
MKKVIRSPFLAYTQIKARITDLTYEPGERLSETKLADEFGLGRSPIRTALLKLESEGWVEISPQSGTFVRALSEREIQELTELRSLLEAHCAGRAVGRVAAEELELLQQKFAIARPKVLAGDIDLALQLDEEVHALLYRLGGNELIADTLTGLRDKVQWIRRAGAISALRIQESFEEIGGVVEALSRRDAAMVQYLIRQHVENAARFCQMTGRPSKSAALEPERS